MMKVRVNPRAGRAMPVFFSATFHSGVYFFIQRLSFDR